jgi:hypothetical protein
MARVTLNSGTRVAQYEGADHRSTGTSPSVAEVNIRYFMVKSAFGEVKDPSRLDYATRELRLAPIYADTHDQDGLSGIAMALGGSSEKGALYATVSGGTLGRPSVGLGYIMGGKLSKSERTLLELSILHFLAEQGIPLAISRIDGSCQRVLTVEEIRETGEPFRRAAGSANLERHFHALLMRSGLPEQAVGKQEPMRVGDAIKA